MKVQIIMTSLVALCVGACAHNAAQTDDGVSNVEAGPATRIEPGEYQERCDGPQCEVDTIQVTEDQFIVYIPAYWGGNPRLDPRHTGSVRGNQVVITISGVDGDPSGPDWRPSPAFTASFEILQASETTLMLKPLDSNLKPSGTTLKFDKK